MKRLRILTWHVHGNYLYYLSQVPHELNVLYAPGGPPGYAGARGKLPWGVNVREVHVDEVRGQRFDCVLFQARRHYVDDQYQLLSPTQRALPRIFLEHDPPQEHPTNTLHAVQDRNALIVHVTAFNALMWDSGITPARVIEHGVVVPPEVRYTGELARGLAVVNQLAKRGRRLGADVYARAAAAVPIDLVGMESQAAGGLGEIPNPELAAFMARYRFFFNPIRYTSLGLAVCEAMTLGLPIVGLATTELATVVRNGVEGFVATAAETLVEPMRALLADRDYAAQLGAAARTRALDRFGIARFVADWNRAFGDVCG